MELKYFPFPLSRKRDLFSKRFIMEGLSSSFIASTTNFRKADICEYNSF